ncbi:hypothetical protein [Oceaniglobus trochenteri]|uniref:hypothetical protein n=1 Tax=Oceaniglobus trochenteri TaxID=2763260 RepID=UPI001CFF6D15|nr:hypothetical protein [Oceaniglobus trochenteri]
MSDYHFQTGILRSQMADALSDNAEQFVFVVTNAFCNVDMDYAIDEGHLGDEAETGKAVANLRRLADALEAGGVS